MSADEIGLLAALDGDLTGLARFVGYVDTQVAALGCTEFHPDIAARLAGWRRETRDLRQYLHGFRDGRGRGRDASLVIQI